MQFCGTGVITTKITTAVYGTEVWLTVHRYILPVARDNNIKKYDWFTGHCG